MSQSDILVGTTAGFFAGVAYLVGYWRGAKYAIKSFTDQLKRS